MVPLVNWMIATSLECGSSAAGVSGRPSSHASMRDHARPVDRLASRVAGDDDQLDLSEAVELLERRQQVLAGDEDLQVGLLDHSLQEDAAGVGVERDGDAARRLRAVERGEELDLVAQEEADVARASEVVEQRVGEAVGLLLGLLERQAAVGEVQPGLVRPLLDLGLQDVQHRALLDREAARERARAWALALVELDHARLEERVDALLVAVGGEQQRGGLDGARPARAR